MGHSRSLLIVFPSFPQKVDNKLFNKCCRRQDSNPGTLVSEATSLSNLPQPLPHIDMFCKYDLIGLFFKILDTNFLSKVVQIFVDFWGYFEKQIFNKRIA